MSKGVTERQKREIKKLMLNIKEAKNNGRPEYIIEDRVKELTDYLQKEGLADFTDE